MSGSNSGSNTSKMAVPQAKEAMNRFKQCIPCTCLPCGDYEYRES